MHDSWYTDRFPSFASTGMDPGTPCSLSYSPMIRDSSSHPSAAFLKIAKVISLTSLLRSLSWPLRLSPFEQFWLGIVSTGLAGSLHWTTRYQGKPMLPSLVQLIPKFTGLGLLGLTGGMVNDTTMSKTKSPSLTDITHDAASYADQFSDDQGPSPNSSDCLAYYGQFLADITRLSCLNYPKSAGSHPRSVLIQGSKCMPRSASSECTACTSGTVGKPLSEISGKTDPKTTENDKWIMIDLMMFVTAPVTTALPRSLLHLSSARTRTMGLWCPLLDSRLQVQKSHHFTVVCLPLHRKPPNIW